MREKLVKQKLCIVLATVLFMLCMVAIMPATANAEDYYYNVYLTSDQVETLDINELILGERYAMLHVSELGASATIPVDYYIYLNNGLIQVYSFDSYTNNEDLSIFPTYKPDNSLSNVDKVTAEYISADNKIIISTYFSSIGHKKVIVLNNGESKTIYKDEINEINDFELLLTHTGNPTGRETLHQKKINADDSEDPRRDYFWYSRESFWLPGYYQADSLNLEPFRADHYADASHNIDNWWEEAHGASYIVASYSEENGFTVKYVWRENEEESDDSSEGNEAVPVHTHSYKWVTISEPTVNSKGHEKLICTICGDVAGIQYVGNDTVIYDSFINSLEEQLKTATSDKGVLLELGNWHSVPDYMMKTIINSNVDVELTYRYEGQTYDIVIPAGKGIDLNIPWYGPLLMSGLYGSK